MLCYALLCSAAAPRIFDLVLLNSEYDMASVRITELAGCVDVMVFLQPAYRFQDDKFIVPGVDRLPFPERQLIGPELQGRVRFVNVSARTPAACAGATIQKRHCRQSFYRNRLVDAFNEAGGRDDDIALVSDADEIPRASSLAALRDNASTLVFRADPYANVKLGAVRHYKMSLRCEYNRGEWLNGPSAVTGRSLRRYGADFVRTTNHPFRRYAVHNASWHLSSISGGVSGSMLKMRSNSGGAAEAPKLRSTGRMPTAKELVALEEHCGDHFGRPGFHENMPSPYHFAGRPGEPLPAYPGVPRSVEHALRRGRLQHFLNFSLPVELLDTLLSTQHILPCARHAHEDAHDGHAAFSQLAAAAQLAARSTAGKLAAHAGSRLAGG